MIARPSAASNELLHNIFIDHVIKQEQEVYTREGVPWQMVEYSDNAHVLALIAHKSSR